MAGFYRSRHLQRTVLYRVLFHYFDRFLVEYESQFEKEYGFLRPLIEEVVERYLDLRKPALRLCPHPLSCAWGRTPPDVLLPHEGFYPSCHSKRLEEWGELMLETLLLDVPHRQVIFTIPRMLRIFFKYKRRLLGSFCQAAVHALLKYFQATTVLELRPGVVASIQSFGQKINFHPHICLLVTRGGEHFAGTFHHVSELKDSLLAEFFKRGTPQIINFSIIYGTSAFSLAKELGTAPREAQRFIDCYFEQHPLVQEFLEATVKEAEGRGYTETIFGRLRQVPELKQKDRVIQQAGRRIALNAPIQGPAADLMKKAMIEIWEEFKAKGLKARMILRVPLKVHLGWGPNWAEAK